MYEAENVAPLSWWPPRSLLCTNTLDERAVFSHMMRFHGHTVGGRECEFLTLCFSVFQLRGSLWIWFSAAEEGAEPLPL